MIVFDNSSEQRKILRPHMKAFIQRLFAVNLTSGSTFVLMALVGFCSTPARAQQTTVPSRDKIAHVSITEGADEFVLRFDYNSVPTFRLFKVHVTDSAGKPLRGMSIHPGCQVDGPNEMDKTIGCDFSWDDARLSVPFTDVNGDATIKGSFRFGLRPPMPAYGRSARSISWDTTLSVSFRAETRPFNPASGLSIEEYRALMMYGSATAHVYAIFAKFDLLRFQTTGKCLAMSENGPSMQNCANPVLDAYGRGSAMQHINIVPVGNTKYVKLQLSFGNLVLYSSKDGRFGTFAGQEFGDQYWEIIPSDKGYRLRSVDSDKCLYSNSEGRLGVGPCGFADQLWSVIWG